MKNQILLTSIILILASISGCATASRSKLDQVEIGDTKQEVVSLLGRPARVGEIIETAKGGTIQLLTYKIYRYQGAISGLSPYYDFYTIRFRDDKYDGIANISYGPDEQQVNQTMLAGTQGLSAHTASNEEDDTNFQPTNEPDSSNPASLTCGIRPIASIGCHIGRCVNGKWEQICETSAGVSCGPKPAPHAGCVVTDCVDSRWHEECDRSPILSCGLKPLPKIGCTIGNCVNGQWEQVCP